MKVTLENSDMRDAILCQLEKMGIDMNTHTITDLSFNTKRDGKNSIEAVINIEKTENQEDISDKDILS